MAAKRLLDAEGLAAYLSISPKSARRFGEKAGAVIRIGRRCLYDVKLINAAIDKMGTSPMAENNHETRSTQDTDIGVGGPTKVYQTSAPK